MKLKCHESGLAQHPLTKASVRKFYSANATRVPFQHFRLHLSQKIPLTFLCTVQKQGITLSLFRNENVKSIIGNKAMHKDISCITYNNQTN